jgi:Uncharacterized protein conserved in bacteria
MLDKIFTLRRKNNKLKVIFDMDDVLADFMPCVLPLLNAMFNRNYAVEDITNWNLKTYYGDNVNDIFNTKGLFYDLKPKKDVLKEFPKIYNNELFDVWIVTACTSTEGYLEKIQWMAKYFPDFPINRIIPCNEKDTVWADVIVDDGLHNLKDFELIGEPVVYDMPHNKVFPDGQVVTYKRIHSMKEVRVYLQRKIAGIHKRNQIAI